MDGHKRVPPETAGTETQQLDPYKNDIPGTLEHHPYSAMRVLQKIREEGYDGGHTIVKDYVRKVRPKRHKPYLKLCFGTRH